MAVNVPLVLEDAEGSIHHIDKRKVKIGIAERIALSYIHCKNKLVVLTTEWLPWLQTNWRDSGYERFSLVWKSNCIRQPKM